MKLCEINLSFQLVEILLQYLCVSFLMWLKVYFSFRCLGLYEATEKSTLFQVFVIMITILTLTSMIMLPQLNDEASAY